MQLYEEELDLMNNRIIELEKNICIMQDNITTLSEHLKETQRFMIKLAHNQGEITKRVSQWPFIAVSRNEGEM